MKKKILLIIMLFLLLPTGIKALEYEVKLSGDDIILSKPQNEQALSRVSSNLYIDITNIENISSFDMYVEYDKTLIGLKTCNAFNYAGGGWYIDGNKNVYYNYKYSNGYKEYFNKYNLYRIGFKPNDSTPESGTTTVTVTIKNAKDLDNNSITIKSVSKTYTFKKYGIYLNNNNNDIIENNNDTVVNNNETTNNDNKSNNNYIKELTIKNYKIKFNKLINEYTININEDVNTLDISLTLEDSKAKYIIIGANDLKKNNNKTLIEITSENGEKNTYTINTKINDNKENNNIEITDTQIKNNSKLNLLKKINKKHLFIGGVIILFIVLICIIISHYDNRKIDKMFKDL